MDLSRRVDVHERFVATAYERDELRAEKDRALSGTKSVLAQMADQRNFV